MHVSFTALMQRWTLAGCLALTSLVMTDVASAATVVPTGPLISGRTQHTATLLPNGSVLIAGGFAMTQYGQLVPSATAEIYNPLTGTFATTGTMTMPRTMHAAAALQNGMVLVVGGGVGKNTAELYNPLTGSWAPTGNMQYVRNGAQAITLKDGRVLIIGDQLIGASASTCEIYDPATGRFTLSGNMPQPRFGASAVLLSDGRVMLAGGGTTGIPYGDTTPIYADLASMIWSPMTGQWTWGPILATQHMNGTATLLPNGKVLLAGGTDATTKPTANAETIDPNAYWGVATGSMSVPRQLAVASLQLDGTVLMAGGLITTQTNPSMTASLESYSPTTGTWQSLGNMTVSRYNFTTTVLANGNVLIAGGATYNPAINQVSGLQASDLLKQANAPTCAGGGNPNFPVSSISVSANGMNSPFPVNAPAGCAWVVASDSPWITLGNASGTGSNNIMIAIAPNPLLSRTGNITINGSVTLQINEAGQMQACSPQINGIGPYSTANFTSAGGTNAIAIDANFACAWQVTGVPSWVTLKSPAQGRGQGAVMYTVAPSFGVARSATLQIGQYSYTITQN